LNKEKILKKILSGTANVKFKEITGLAEAFGFSLSRIKGSHHIFTHPKIPELINLQNVKGNAKPYQINQFINLIEKYNLKLKK
jgi:predicted RNA binding protein YcfA (HicA-like mRNA interferase family)